LLSFFWTVFSDLFIILKNIYLEINKIAPNSRAESQVFAGSLGLALAVSGRMRRAFALTGPGSYRSAVVLSSSSGSSFCIRQY